MAPRRKIIVYLAVSADGFIARKDGSVDWLESSRLKGDHGMAAFYRTIDTCVMGRKTYDVAVKFGMSDGYAGKKNYVFTRSRKQSANPKVRMIHENVTGFSQRLRAERGKNIWLVGGAELVGAFLAAAQVDEFIVHVTPTLIGEGIPLIAPRHCEVNLKLVESKAFRDGVVRLHYAVRK